MTIPRLSIRDLHRHWNLWGKDDPLWAILTRKGKERGGWSEEEFFETGRAEVAAALDYLKSRQIEVSRGTALDFGCGVGRLSQALGDQFDKVHGVDISATMIERAKTHNRHGDRCRYHLNVADNLLLFANGTFDFIYSSITLQHMDPQYMRRYVKEFVRVLKPSGVLLFQLPSHSVRDGEIPGTTRAPGYSLGTIASTRKALGYCYYSAKEVAREMYFKMVYKLRYWRRKPLFEMYGTPPVQVVRFLEELGMEVVDIRADDQVAESWHSYWYCARPRNPAQRRKESE